MLQGFEVHELQQFADNIAVGVFGQCEFQLLADGHVREECEVLKDEANGTAAGGEVDPPAAVEPGFVVYFDMAFVDFCQAGEDAQKRDRKSVVLPAPEGPDMARISPCFASKAASNHCWPRAVWSIFVALKWILAWPFVMR